VPVPAPPPELDGLDTAVVEDVDGLLIFDLSSQFCSMWSYLDSS
jgi:hypothetical protein